MNRFFIALAIASPALVLSVGCNSSGFGSDLATAPRASAVKAGAATIVIPTSEKFSIVTRTSEEHPAQGGKANAQPSTVDAGGKATAAAAVENGGKANAGFQLGHAFKNETDTQSDYEFTVRFHCEYDVVGDAQARAADAVAELLLYGRDGHNRVAREQTLTSATTESGPVKRALSDAVTFTITVGPGEIATVYLAGQVKIDTPETRSAHGNLKISDVQIELTPHPAPSGSAGHK